MSEQLGDSLMQFDRNKLRAVILYACHACPPDRMGAVKLHKILYFTDMIRYADAGCSVTGSKYIKRPHGPTNLKLLPMLSEMARDGQIEINEVDYHGFRKKEYKPLARPDDGTLSAEELSLIDEVIDFVCMKNSAKTISDYSHNKAWEMAEFGEEIPYRRAYLLFPSDVSPEAFEATERGMAQIEAAKPDRKAVVFTPFRVFRERIQAAGQ